MYAYFLLTEILRNALLILITYIVKNKIFLENKTKNLLEEHIVGIFCANIMVKMSLLFNATQLMFFTTKNYLLYIVYKLGTFIF